MKRSILLMIAASLFLMFGCEQKPVKEAAEVADVQPVVGTPGQEMPVVQYRISAADFTGGPRTGPTPPADTIVYSDLESPTLTYIGSYRLRGMRAPLRIAVAPNGNQVVSDPQAGLVHIFSRGGKHLKVIGAAERPLGVAVKGSGNILIGDEKTASVLEISASGLIANSFCPAAGVISKPNDIAIAATGDVWIVDSAANRIIKCSDAGELLLEMGSPGTTAGKFNFPTGIAVDNSTGNILVSDSNNGRVQVFDANGVYLKSIGKSGSGDGKIVRGQGLAIDYLNRLYLAEVFQGQLELFDLDGGFIGWASQQGTEPGQLKLPSDVVIDSYNRLFITSYDTGKVEIFGVDEYTIPVDGIDAAAALSPPNINGNQGKSKGKIHLFLDVPDSDVPIDIASIMLDGYVSVLKQTGEKDDNDDDEDEKSAKKDDDDEDEKEKFSYGDKTFEAKYLVSRADLLSLHSEPGDYEIEITGTLTDGTPIIGTVSLAVK